MSNIQQIRLRRDAIADILLRRNREPISAPDLCLQLQQQGETTLRTVQRDLVALQEQDLVKRKGDGWLAGEALTQNLFDDLATSVALEIVSSSLSWAIPLDVQRDLAKTLARAKKRVKSAFGQNPQIRWLNALRILPATHPLDQPIIDADVRDAIENAILNKLKVRLTYSTKGQLLTKDVSISHFLLTLPDNPRVVAWPDGQTKHEVIDLHCVEKADVLDLTAIWPVAFEPQGIDARLAAAGQGLKRIEIRVSPSLMNYWKGRTLGKQLSVLSIDAEGWSTCQFLANDTAGLSRYLLGFSYDVEVIRPYPFRMFIEGHVRSAARLYEASKNQNDMDRDAYFAGLKPENAQLQAETSAQERIAKGAKSSKKSSA